ncbi:hypothetical protein EGW08_011724 [Elysia chlorotica]|uniref:Fibronectin type-III domain-containing protein n=1 Tax=Elysia chlorotica TaxID=188477 RepID=A0A433TG00_ELYCH|nr:hypothetical protein EGW08_011724 [Elysia chlorotica]
MTHQLRVGAITENGTGVMSPWVDSTYYGNPDKPGAPENLIIRPNLTSIEISWSRPQFTGSRVTGYIVGYGRFIPEVYRVVLPGTQQWYKITDLNPNSQYIVSVRTFNTVGESQPNFRKVHTLRVPPVRAPLLRPTNLSVQSDSPTSLLVRWLDPAIVDEQQMLDGRTYLIRYSPMSGESYIYVKATNHAFRLSDLDPATSYEVSVRTLRGNNSSDWSLSVVNSTQQTTPSSAPRNLTIIPSHGNPMELQLRWMPPEKPNGNIEEYFVYRSLDQSLNSKLWNVTATNQRYITLGNVIPYRTIYFRLQARNGVGYGPLSPITAFKPQKGESQTNGQLEGHNTKNRGTSPHSSPSTTEVPRSTLSKSQAFTGRDQRSRGSRQEGIEHHRGVDGWRNEWLSKERKGMKREREKGEGDTEEVPAKQGSNRTEKDLEVEEIHEEIVDTHYKDGLHEKRSTPQAGGGQTVTSPYQKLNGDHNTSHFVKEEHFDLFTDSNKTTHSQRPTQTKDWKSIETRERHSPTESMEWTRKETKESQRPTHYMDVQTAMIAKSTPHYESTSESAGKTQVSEEPKVKAVFEPSGITTLSSLKRNERDEKQGPQPKSIEVVLENFGTMRNSSFMSDETTSSTVYEGERSLSDRDDGAI